MNVFQFGINLNSNLCFISQKKNYELVVLSRVFNELPYGNYSLHSEHCNLKSLKIHKCEF